MSIFQGIFSNFISNEDDDYEYDEMDNVLDDEEDSGASVFFSRKKNNSYRDEEDVSDYSSTSYSESYSNRSTDDYSRKQKAKSQPQPITRGSAKLVPLHSVKSNKVFVIKPQDFNESQSIVDFLREGKVIVINMDGLEIEFAQRIIDFIGGACYAIDGSLKAVSRTIFIAAPNGTEITGDLRDEILNASTTTTMDLHKDY